MERRTNHENTRNQRRRAETPHVLRSMEAPAICYPAQPPTLLSGGKQGAYSYWDPQKAQKEMTVLYSDLEEKVHSAYAAGQTMQMGAPQAHQQAPPVQRAGAFQGMGMAAM